VTLVHVKPACEPDDRLPRQGTCDQHARVTYDGGPWESRNVCVGDTPNVVEAVRETGEARPENETDQRTVGTIDSAVLLPASFNGDQWELIAATY